MSQFVPLVSCGESWRLSYATPEIRARFSGWCAAQAQLELAAQREFLPPDLYRERSTALQADIAAKMYRWGSPHEKRAMGSGVERILSSLDVTSEAWIFLMGQLLKHEHGELPAEKVIAIMADDVDLLADAIHEVIHGPNAPKRRLSREEVERRIKKAEAKAKASPNGTEPTPSRQTTTV